MLKYSKKFLKRQAYNDMLDRSNKNIAYGFQNLPFPVLNCIEKGQKIIAKTNPNLTNNDLGIYSGIVTDICSEYISIRLHHNNVVMKYSISAFKSLTISYK